MDGAVRILGIGGIIFEFLTIHAVPAFLMAGTDMPCSLTALKKGLDKGKMARACGANETIIGDVPTRPEVGVQGGNLIAMIRWTDVLRFGRALNLLAVFINTGNEHDVLAFETLKTSERITGERGVHASEVGLGVDVIERRCEAVGHRVGSLLRPLALGLDLNDLLFFALVSMPSPIQCAEVRRVWLSALHQLALADGDFSEGERRALADHLSKTLPDADLNWDGLPPAQDSDLAEAFAEDRTLAEQFLRSAVVVSLADGHFSAMELNLLHHWADLLGCDQSPLKGLQPCDAPTSARSIHPLEPLKQWLDALDPSDPAVAGFIVSLIPAQCPFERDIVLFGHKLVHIPPMCKLNPLYDQLVGLRFRCLGHLPEEQQLRICRKDSAPA